MFFSFLCEKNPKKARIELKMIMKNPIKTWVRLLIYFERPTIAMKSPDLSGLRHVLHTPSLSPYSLSVEVPNDY